MKYARNNRIVLLDARGNDEITPIIIDTCFNHILIDNLLEYFSNWAIVVDMPISEAKEFI